MSPGEQTAFFALLSVLFFVISLFSNDDDWLPSVGCTGVLVFYWALNTMLWMLSIVEDWSLGSDTLFTLASLALVTALRRMWLVVLAALFLLSVALDLLHRGGWLDYSAWAEAGNGIFVAQLATASFPGVRALAGKLLSVPGKA